MDYRKFFRAEDMKKEIVEGDVLRYIYTGKNLQVVEYHFPAHRDFPLHSHDIHEQMGYLVSGKIELEIDGEARILEPGDWYHAAVGLSHKARTFDEPSVMLDIFSPIRDDLK